MVDNENIRILLVEGNEGQCSKTLEYIQQIPNRKFIVDCSYSFDDALQKLKDNEYNVYFVDYFLGDKNGLELLFEAMNSGCNSPVILLSTEGNREMDIKAMEIGAYDYIIKSDLNTENLERCIRYSLERARSLNALIDSERKYRSIFEKAKDVVFIATEDFKIIDINYAVTELLEYDQEELLLSNFSAFFNNERDYKLLLNILDEFGEYSGFQADLVSKNGEVKNCIISASFEINKDGIVYLQVIIHDNTSRKRAEKSSLQTEKLAAAGRLVRTLAHEVRNPLNNINLSIEQLSNQINGDADAAMYLDIVQRNAKRIGDLITELLDSSRVDLQMNSHKGSLQHVLDKAIVSANDRITLKNIEFELIYPPKPAYIIMDEEKLKVAFLNLIINAIEAMDEAKSKLTISVLSLNNVYQVFIKDNGIGIAEENMHKLFEPYFTSKRNGMGLGLANTFSIIQSHNAQVEVQSKIGKGTEFVIEFQKAN